MFGNKLVKYFFLPLAIGLAIFSAYTWVSLHWAYSSGERAGYVQKLSRKGYVCKTWEGEMVLVSMPGTQAEKFLFTIKDERIVPLVNASLGKRVKIHYEEHKGIPSSCFGDSAYFVQSVEPVQD